MAVRIEPPRGRSGPREGAKYPGLTPEERGQDPVPLPSSPAEDDAPSPLWMIPSELPPSARALGFAERLPERFPEPPPPDPPVAEGLFDVPGLLERLWLARALEAHREREPTGAPAVAPEGRRPSLSPVARSGGIALPSAHPSPPAVDLPPPEPEAAHDVPGASNVAPAGSSAASWLHPRSWVCPYCYLTNDVDATTCRGCRSSSLHL